MKKIEYDFNLKEISSQVESMQSCIGKNLNNLQFELELFMPSLNFNLYTDQPDRYDLASKHSRLRLSRLEEILNLLKMEKDLSKYPFLDTHLFPYSYDSIFVVYGVHEVLKKININSIISKTIQDLYIEDYYTVNHALMCIKNLDFKNQEWIECGLGDLSHSFAKGLKHCFQKFNKHHIEIRLIINQLSNTLAEDLSILQEEIISYLDPNARDFGFNLSNSVLYILTDSYEHLEPYFLEESKQKITEKLIELSSPFTENGLKHNNYYESLALSSIKVIGKADFYLEKILIQEEFEGDVSTVFYRLKEWNYIVDVEIVKTFLTQIKENSFLSSKTKPVLDYLKTLPYDLGEIRKDIKKLNYGNNTTHKIIHKKYILTVDGAFFCIFDEQNFDLADKAIEKAGGLAKKAKFSFPVAKVELEGDGNYSLLISNDEKITEKYNHNLIESIEIPVANHLKITSFSDDLIMPLRAGNYQISIFKMSNLNEYDFVVLILRNKD